MNQKTITGVALLAVGLILLYFGYNASESITEGVTEAVTGRYTDKTMYYLIGGAVSSVIGLVILI